MKKVLNYIMLFTLLVAFVGCEDFLEPNYNNKLSEEALLDYQKNPEYVAGLYVPAYGAIPGSYTTVWNNTSSNFLDCTTDNAVTNDYESTP